MIGNSKILAAEIMIIGIIIVSFGVIFSDANGQESEFLHYVTLDKKTYTWTDKVHITVYAPSHNLDSNKIEEIGDSDQYPVKVATRGYDLDNYKLVETGFNTGIFTGEVTLTGFSFNADGDKRTGIDGNDVIHTEPSGKGPTDGLLPADDDDGITVSFEFAEDQTVVGSAHIRWNEGTVQWLDSSYVVNEYGIVRIVDPDMNLDPEKSDGFDIDVWSDSDLAGISLPVTETGNSTGVFEVTVGFTNYGKTGDKILRVSGGDTITAEYEDNTLPAPHTTADELHLTSTASMNSFDSFSSDILVFLDKDRYHWTDKVRITVTSQEHNIAKNIVDEIGSSKQERVFVSTRGHIIENYKLVETDVDTGVFIGEVTLSGFTHDVDGSAMTGDKTGSDTKPQTGGIGPDDGFLESDGDDGITVFFEVSDDRYILATAPIIWSTGTTEWLEKSYDVTGRWVDKKYDAMGTGVVRVTDADMNLDPEKFDEFFIDVWSDSDAGGIDLKVTETAKENGIFEGTVFFTTTGESSEHSLRVSGGDTITAEYEDNTLPAPHTTADELDITAESKIHKIPDPPLKQQSSGIWPEDIQCKDSFSKVFSSDGSVACVKSSSVAKLSLRGWNENFTLVDFSGSWKNVDESTNDIANLKITRDDSGITVNAWSSCNPDVLCDWGESSGTVNRNSVMVSWKIDSITHDLTITKIGNKLQVDRESISFDPRWTQNKQMNFIPGTLNTERQ